MRSVYDRKGLILVTVLWVVIILIVILTAVMRTSLLDTKLCFTGAEMLRCKWACRAGVDTAIAVLKEDPTASDSLGDMWSRNDKDFNDVMLEQCLFSVRVVDEAGKLNINTATKEQLLELVGMTEEIASAIIDWRDNDDNPGEGGAEAGYYINLPYGYRIRNGPFRTIRELLLVKDVVPELLYGEDTNLNGQLDYNETDGDKSPPADNGDDKLDVGWIAYLTCCSYDKNKDAAGDDRININEADENRLKESLDIKGSYAKWIVENRENRNYESISDLINNNSPKKADDSDGDSDQAKPIDLKTFADIADKITITNDNQIQGRVNINTAPKEVLVALLGDSETNQQLAQNIITYRENLFDGMESIAEVMQVSSMKIDTFKKIANYITTRGNVFTIRSFATAERGGLPGATLQTEAIVDRDQTPCRVLYWYQGASN